MPIITKNFHESDWTDQECGFAIALKKVIIPLMSGKEPYGFINRYQGQKGKYIRTEKIIPEIFKSILSDRLLKNRFKKLIIDKFIKSKSYSDSTQFSQILLSVNYFSPNELVLLIKAQKDNNQIYGCSKAFDNLEEIFNRYKK
jgi:hypothetical protein